MNFFKYIIFDFKLKEIESFTIIESYYIAKKEYY